MTLPAERPETMLSFFEKHSPHAVRRHSAWRDGFAARFQWPEHVWMPDFLAQAELAPLSPGAGGAIVSDLYADLNLLSTFASWRLSKNVFRILPRLEPDLGWSDLIGPMQVPCVYLDFSGAPLALSSETFGEIVGCFVRSDWDPDDAGAFPFVLTPVSASSDLPLAPVPVRFRPGSGPDQAVSEMVRRAEAVIAQRNNLLRTLGSSRQIPCDFSAQWRHGVASALPLVRLVARFLIALGDETRLVPENGAPPAPCPPRGAVTRRGLRFYPAQRVASWRILLDFRKEEPTRFENR